MRQDEIPTVVIGNIEGNPCTIIKLLHSNKLITSPDPMALIGQAEAIYSIDQTDLNRKQMINWRTLITSFNIRQCRIIINSDVVATTAKNDLLMLELIHKIFECIGHNLEILVSPRDILFLHVINNNKLEQQTDYDDRPSGNFQAKKAQEIYTDAIDYWSIDRIIDANDSTGSELLEMIRGESGVTYRHQAISSLRHCIESIDHSTYNKPNELEKIIKAYKDALVPIAFHLNRLPKEPNSILEFEQLVWRSKHQFQKSLKSNPKELIAQYLKQNNQPKREQATDNTRIEFIYSSLRESSGIIVSQSNLTPQDVINLLELYTSSELSMEERMRIACSCHLIQASERGKFDLIKQYDGRGLNPTTFLSSQVQLEAIQLQPQKQRALLLHIKHINEQAIKRVNSRKKKQQLAMHLSLIEIQLNKETIPSQRVKYILEMLNNKLRVKSGRLQSKTYQYFIPVLETLKQYISTAEKANKFNSEEYKKEHKKNEIKDSTRKIITDMLWQSETILRNQVSLIPINNQKRQSIKRVIGHLSDNKKCIDALKEDEITIDHISEERSLIDNAIKTLATHRFCITTMCLKPNSYYVCHNNLKAITECLDNRRKKLGQAVLNQLIRNGAKHTKYSQPEI